MGNRTYISNLTVSLMGQIGVSLKTIESYNTDPTDFYMLAHDLWGQYAYRVNEVLCRMKPETLGKIAACGLCAETTVDGSTSLYDVHCERWLDKYASGRDLLLKIACTTVIAEMADILKLRILQSERAA